MKVEINGENITYVLGMSDAEMYSLSKLLLEVERWGVACPDTYPSLREDSRRDATRFRDVLAVIGSVRSGSAAVYNRIPTEENRDQIGEKKEVCQ